ncbi:MAG: GGDEF domain-containing protein [Desulfobacter sp.]|nr:MAG: GGDEF domain-containing protein [Desulfobacter sp.]
MLVLLCMFSAYMAFMSIRGNTEYHTALKNEALLEQETKGLEKISNSDGLTGLYNRRYFDTALEIQWQEAMRNKSRLSLMIADIDSFKQVNDRFGHLCGDEYLKMISHILGQVFRRKTDIIARFGGEEFVVLMSDLPPGAAHGLAEDFRQKIERSELTFESKTVQTTVSMGVAQVLPCKGQQMQTLISRADTMLYKAKEKGRNRVEIYQE